MSKKQENESLVYDGLKVAILVDGGFYRRRAFTAHGEKSQKKEQTN